MTDEKILATVKPDGEYWQPELETMPREQLRQLQVKKLKDTINVCLKSPFYKNCVTTILLASLEAIWTMRYVSTLPVARQVIPASYFIQSTIFVHGLI